MKGFPLIRGCLVRHFRKTAGLSQEKLAELAGVNTLTVRRLEKESSLTSHITVMLIARALQVEPANFYDLDDLEQFMAGRLDSVPVFDVVERSSEPIVPDKELCERLRLVPKSFSGTRFRLSFANPKYWQAAEPTQTENMFLESGSSISSYPMINNCEGDELGHFAVYASADSALALLDLNPLVEVEVNARLVYAVIPDEMGNAFISHPSEPRAFKDATGFAIDEIVRVQG